jgi:hypothetical protein
MNDFKFSQRFDDNIGPVFWEAVPCRSQLNCGRFEYPSVSNFKVRLAGNTISTRQDHPKISANDSLLFLCKVE